MKIEVFSGNWTVEYVKDNPNKLFVYGDNNLRIGKGGQAVIRGIENTAGLRTKKGPSNKPAAFYTDKEFEQNVINIREDILNIKSLSSKYDSVVFSDGGYGTGLASLEKVAPNTFQTLCALLDGYFGYDNISGKIFKKIPGFDEIRHSKYISLDNKQFNSNVVSPTNNSFFLSEYLESEIFTIYDLIRLEKKTAFTYPLHHNPGEIVIFVFGEQKNYIVARICDSYQANFVSSGDWLKWEGFTEEFLHDKNLKGLYQNHFQFICTMDDKGNMTYKSNLLADSDKKKPEVNPKVFGQNLVFENKLKLDKKFEKMLIEKGISGDVKEIENKSGLIVKKKYFQVFLDGTYYKVQFNQSLFYSSLDIIQVSKKPFV